MQSDFVAAVSHDFRTPLTSLRQYSELLASGRVASDEHRRKYYGFLVQESQRLQRLVEGLLDFGRMEAGAKEFNLEPLPARPWVEEVTAEFQREVEEDGYQVDVDWRGPDVTLSADRMAMSQALWNLLDNAVRYSPDSRTVGVEVERETRHLLIHVRDRGLGIKPEERRKIFEKFVRGSAALCRSTEGTGLGLTMVRHTVEAHGGTISVESEPEQGSTFTISLPVEE
jgi:signal transduction histidine kinase